MWTDFWLRCEGGHQNKFTSTSMKQVVSITAHFAGVFSKKVFCYRLELPLSHRPHGLVGRPSRSGCRFHVWELAGLLVAGLLLFQPQRAASQPFSEALTSKAVNANETSADARIQILTRPIGALVFLEGEYAMAGRTPYTITHYLNGVYHIRATKTGYENWSTDYIFNGRGDDKLTIKLKPKTRIKAVLRSAVLPGRGQAYADQRVKGLLISLAQFSAAGFSVYENFRYDGALNDYRDALNRFQAQQTPKMGRVI